MIDNSNKNVRIDGIFIEMFIRKSCQVDDDKNKLVDVLTGDLFMNCRSLQKCRVVETKSELDDAIKISRRERWSIWPLSLAE